jgi:hypothetical protein
VLAIAVLGFRHGFDVDHVAAIGDISAGSLTRRKAFVLCEIYVLGHALMVVLVGLALAATGLHLPDTGRLVGATLVLLGGYVLWCAAADRRPRSRAELFHGGFQRLRRRLRPTVTVVHEHDHVHDHRDHGHAHPAPDHRTEPSEPVTTRVGHRHRHVHADLPAPYTIGSTVAIGFVHGLGAETPTQVLALSAGTSSLVPFIAGLAVGNTIVAALAVSALSAQRVRLLNVVVAVFSLLVGIPYLLGGSLIAW